MSALAARKRKEPVEIKQKRRVVESLVEGGEAEEEEEEDDDWESADGKGGGCEFVCARSCWH
jgi:hypothetical protein